MASNVHHSVKTAATVVVIKLQEAVRRDVRSNLKIKESHDEIIQRDSGRTARRQANCDDGPAQHSKSSLQKMALY
jgi:hypothetical protein